jgi:iron complex transport system ATP-binding protein
MLKVENISVSYGARLALNKVSLELPAGCILGLIGPNGAGKTTLLRALCGVLPLRSGAIRVDGSELTRLSAMQRARLMAVVPQANHLPPAFTAWETVLLGRTPYLNWLGQVSSRDEEAARQAMERTHTIDLAERRIGELSGGEQQRLLLARALAQGAPILLMDEPTTHLDLQYQYSLLEQVKKLAHEDHLAVLVALHDLNLVERYADRVVVLVGGELVAAGKPAEVLTAPLLSQVYCLPLSVIQTRPGGPSIILPAG